MRQLLYGQINSFEICWTLATFIRSRLEMRRNKYGLYYRPPKHAARSWLYTGHCGSPYQVSAFCTSQNRLSRWNVCWAVCFPDHEVTWSTKNHNLRSRTTVYSSFLGTLVQGVRHQPSSKFWLSSLDSWANWTCESDFGRYVACLCPLFKGFMGEMATFSWVHLQ
jgi:hypothetical protein